MTRYEPTPLRAMAHQELPGLRRALGLLREEARSYPGPEGTAALQAAQRAIEREISQLERAEAVR